MLCWKLEIERGAAYEIGVSMNRLCKNMPFVVCMTTFAV